LGATCDNRRPQAASHSLLQRLAGALEKQLLGGVGKLHAFLLQPLMQLEVDVLLDVHVHRIVGAQDVIDRLEIQGIRRILLKVRAIETGVLAAFDDFANDPGNALEILNTTRRSYMRP
jgi:hypothetical protein